MDLGCMMSCSCLLVVLASSLAACLQVVDTVQVSLHGVDEEQHQLMVLISQPTSTQHDTQSLSHPLWELLPSIIN
eukprot:5803104-Amphidinium_carterae.1